MNVLYVVPYVPNLIRVRPYNLIRRLAARGHRVTVAAVYANEQELAGLDSLRAECHQVRAWRLPGWRSLWNCVRALPSGKPLQSTYSWDAGFSAEITRLACGGDGRAAFDVVHVEHLRGSRYALDLKAALLRRGLSTPIIWDSVDSISLLFRQTVLRSRSLLSRGVTRFELGRTERYEGWLVGQFDRVLVTSPADREALLALPQAEGEPSSVTVLRNGVDLEYFRPQDGAPRQPATLVISGKMSYHANVTMALEFAEGIMPLVWARRPDVRVWIVGKDPPRKIRELGRHPNLSVTGTVGDIRPYLQGATLAVAPIAYGVGIQNKVLEAMACGAPVVATPQAVAALDVVADRDLVVAEDRTALAEAILVLLEDPEKRRRLSQAGRAYVEACHDWRAAGAQLESIYVDSAREKLREIGRSISVAVRLDEKQDVKPWN